MRYSALPLHALVLVVPVIHLLIAPYTKVEESFTLHAARDVLEHGFFSQHAIEQVSRTSKPPHRHSYRQGSQSSSKAISTLSMTVRS